MSRAPDQKKKAEALKLSSLFISIACTPLNCYYYVIGTLQDWYSYHYVMIGPRITMS
jgi:hypothetical protein